MTRNTGEPRQTTIGELWGFFFYLNKFHILLEILTSRRVKENKISSMAMPINLFLALNDKLTEIYRHTRAFKRPEIERIWLTC